MLPRSSVDDPTGDRLNVCQGRYRCLRVRRVHAEVGDVSIDDLRQQFLSDQRWMPVVQRFSRRVRERMTASVCSSPPCPRLSGLGIHAQTRRGHLADGTGLHALELSASSTKVA
jgi:hypothetical protein